MIRVKNPIFNFAQAAKKSFFAIFKWTVTKLDSNFHQSYIKIPIFIKLDTNFY